MIEYGVPADSWSFNCMLSACARAHKMERAEYWLNKMKSGGTPATLLSYTHMIHGYVQDGNAEKAEQWFKHMEDAGIKPDRVAYNNLLQAYKASDNVEKVEYYTQRMEADGIERKNKKGESKKLGERVLSGADEAVRQFGRAGIKANLKEKADMVKESMRIDREGAEFTRKAKQLSTKKDISRPQATKSLQKF